MKLFSDRPSESTNTASSSPWNDRILMAAVIVTMLLSLFGYMHG